MTPRRLACALLLLSLPAAAQQIPVFEPGEALTSAKLNAALSAAAAKGRGDALAALGALGNGAVSGTHYQVLGNLDGRLPAGSMNGLLGWNLTSGLAEVDFVNMASNPAQAFGWWQKTAAAPRSLMTLGPDGLSLPGAGAFYSDRGARVARFGDRLLVGAAADNPGRASRDDQPTDWLTTVMGATSIGAYATWGAQGASIARFGTIGFLAASRTSDARAATARLGYTPSSIGQAAWCINDDTANPTTTTCYGQYAEAWRMAGVSYQPTFGQEVEVVNFGGLAVGSSNPFHTNVGGGTYGVQYGCGGGQTSGTSDCDAVMVTVANNNRFRRGIVFGAASLAGTDGLDNGFAEAVSFGRNQGLVWHTNEVSGGETGDLAGALIRSTVQTNAKGSRLEFQEGAAAISNMDGQTLFAVLTTKNVSNVLVVQAGVGNGAAGLYASGSTNANLGLYPGAGGELQIGSPVTTSQNALPAVPDGGYLHINVNGADLRVPLLSPAQAGG